jgi:hypothetical protein
MAKICAPNYSNYFLKMNSEISSSTSLPQEFVQSFNPHPQNYSALTIDSEALKPPKNSLKVEIIFIIMLYMLVVPFLLLFIKMVLRNLRQSGCVSQREADEMMENASIGVAEDIPRIMLAKS